MRVSTKERVARNINAVGRGGARLEERVDRDDKVGLGLAEDFGPTLVQRQVGGFLGEPLARVELGIPAVWQVVAHRRRAWSSTAAARRSECGPRRDGEDGEDDEDDEDEDEDQEEEEEDDDDSTVRERASGAVARRRAHTAAGAVWGGARTGTRAATSRGSPPSSSTTASFGCTGRASGP